MQALQIRYIACYVEGDDLPSALTAELEVASKAFKDETASGRSVSLSHNILTGTYVGHLHGKRSQSLPLFIRQIEDAFQLADDWFGIPVCRLDHDSAPLVTGGSTVASLCH